MVQMLSRYLQWMALYALFYLLTYVSDANLTWVVTRKHSCKSQTTQGVLNIKNRKTPGKLLYSAELGNQECRGLCCDVNTCNSYVWHKTGHCFLFYCNSGDKCQVIPNDNAETGFIYRPVESGKGKPLANVDNHVSPLKRDKQDESHGEVPESSEAKWSQPKPAFLTKEQGNGQPVDEQSRQNVQDKSHSRETDGYQALDSTSKDPLDASKESDAVVSEDSDETENIKRIEEDKPVNTPHTRQQGVTITGHRTNAKFSIMQTTNSTQRTLVTQQVTRKASHTTTTSLILALFFGVVFLLAVLFLIGKRWWESMSGNHKDSYSRVSFLMNGM